MGGGPAPFAVDVDLGGALASAAARGWEHVPGALSARFLAALQEEVEDGPFEAAPCEVGEVRQQVEGYVLTPASTGFPRAQQLREELTQRVQREGAPVQPLALFVANEVHVQRYHPGSRGITSHRDGSRFRPLIAVFTTRGTARFAVSRERHGEPSALWTVTPGDLVLLRGPGLGGAEDGRPFHTVSGPDDVVRYSVSVRRNAVPRDEPPASR